MLEPNSSSKSLKSIFAATKPREKAGATVSSRFDFQKDVSVWMLLEQEEKDNDYLFIFDFHEDLVVMNAETEPDQVAFYQIKGKKTGNWSLKSLSKTELDKQHNPLLSIIGKLWDCREKFSQGTNSLNFLSNARFRLGLLDQTDSTAKDKIIASELCIKDQEYIRQNIRQQLDLKADPTFEDLLNFQVLDISLSDSERHLKGILVDFFQRKYDLAPDVNAIYKNLISEVRKRSGYDRETHTFEDLVKHKGISKSAFCSWINDIIHQEKTLKAKWTELVGILTQEGLHYKELKALKEGWTNYELLSKDPNNQYVNQVIRQIQKINVGDVAESEAPLHEKLGEIYAAIQTKIPHGLGDASTTKAIILNQLY